MAVRFESPGNDESRLNGVPFPPEDVGALWKMWPTILTLHWYFDANVFHLVDHEYNVQMNFPPEEATDFQQWIDRLNKLEKERERKRSKRARTATYTDI